MADDDNPADARVEWLRSKIVVSLAKENDKKFDKAFYAEETLAKFVVRRQYIGQLELLAAPTPYISLPEHVFLHRDVLHFIDNTSAQASLTKGFSSAPDSAFIVHTFHAIQLRLQCREQLQASGARLPSKLSIPGALELEGAQRTALLQAYITRLLLNDELVRTEPLQTFLAKPAS